MQSFTMSGVAFGSFLNSLHLFRNTFRNFSCLSKNRRPCSRMYSRMVVIVAILQQSLPPVSVFKPSITLRYIRRLFATSDKLTSLEDDGSWNQM